MESTVNIINNLLNFKTLPIYRPEDDPLWPKKPKKPKKPSKPKKPETKEVLEEDENSEV